MAMCGRRKGDKLVRSGGGELVACGFCGRSQLPRYRRYVWEVLAVLCVVCVGVFSVLSCGVIVYIYPSSVEYQVTQSRAAFFEIRTKGVVCCWRRVAGMRRSRSLLCLSRYSAGGLHRVGGILLRESLLLRSELFLGVRYWWQSGRCLSKEIGRCFPRSELFLGAGIECYISFKATPCSDCREGSCLNNSQK